MIDCALTALNLPIVLTAMNQIVAIAFATWYSPLLYSAALPSPCFVSQIFSEEGIHRPFKADMEFRDFTLCKCGQGDTGKLKAFIDSGNVFLIAA